MLSVVGGDKTNNIKIKYEYINSNDFFNSFTKMMKLTGLDQQAKYEIKKIGEKILKEYDHLRDRSMGLIMTYSKKDEKGLPMKAKNEKGQEEFVLSDKVAYDQAFQKLMGEEIEIARQKLKYKFLGIHPDITPTDINALGEIIEFPTD